LIAYGYWGPAAKIGYIQALIFIFKEQEKKKKVYDRA
jgi:hypothetical protein